MGEKVYIARQDTLEEVKADTAALKADTTQIKTDTAATKADAGSILARIGLTGDTGGSQAAGTVMGKENAILGALERIYRTSCFRDITAIEQASFTVNESVPANTTTESKRLLKTVVLEHDFCLTGVMASASSSSLSTGSTHASFIVAVNDIEIPAFAAYATKNGAGSSNGKIQYYNNLLNTWVVGGDYILTYGSPSGLFPTSFAIEKFFLFRKGTTLKIYSAGTNSDTTGARTVSGTLKGYYIKI